MTESVIDIPKQGLCPDVWELVMDATGSKQVWELTTEARLKIEKVAKHLMDWMSISGYAVHIVGSITSNQYSPASDIDVHFLLRNQDGSLKQLTEEQASAYTKSLRAEFDENFKDMYFADSFIGKHPIEVYFQGNIYQDLMSVGCYDLYGRKWLVGPELADPSFNPYSAYYKDIMASAESALKRVRDQLLRTYEAAVVCLKSKQPDDVKRLETELKTSSSIYSVLTSKRKSVSSPSSVEDALKKRNSKSWKIANATFKLIDKFGYMPIFKSFTEMSELAGSPELALEIASSVVKTVKKFLGDETRLAEKEALHENAIAQRDKQLKQVFESWNPKYDSMPQNEFGEEWETLDGNHYVVCALKKFASECQIDPEKEGPKEDRIYVWDVHKVKDGPYIANFGGGANGGGNEDKWLSYLSIVKKMARKIFDKFGSVWLLDFDNDCCDDVWTLRLCFEDKEETEECQFAVPAECVEAEHIIEDDNANDNLQSILRLFKKANEYYKRANSEDPKGKLPVYKNVDENRSYFVMFCKEHPKLLTLDYYIKEFATDLKKHNWISHLNRIDPLDGYDHDTETSDYKRGIYRMKFHRTWNLIDPIQYKHILDDFMKNGEMTNASMSTLRSMLDSICENVLAIIATHTISTILDADDADTPVLDPADTGLSRLPWSNYTKNELREMFIKNGIVKKENADTLITDVFSLWYDHYARFTDDKYDKAADTDFGLPQYVSELGNLPYDPTPAEAIVCINRCIDFGHFRSDLASAFIKGGSAAAEKISNGTKDDVE